MIQIGFKSSKGIKRKNNEDACFVMPKEEVYIVADGVGGNNAGELASRTAVTSVAAYIKKNPIGEMFSEEQIGEYFKDCMEEANKKVYDLAEKYEQNRGMATTLVVCHLKENRAYISNVGDSRAYIFRKGTLSQLTEDHTYVNSLIKMGIITEDEAKGHQKVNMITKALGAEREIAPDFYTTDLNKGDMILLCTDGLYGELDNKKMEKIIKKEENMPALTDEFIKAANKAGGRDNITVICIKVDGGENNEQ